MGYFKSFTAGGANGNATTVRIDRDIHTLVVRRLCNTQTDYYLRGRNPEVVNATIRNHSGSLEDIIKRCSLGDLAAFSQYGGSPIFELNCDADGQQAARDLMCITEGLAVPTANKWLATFAIQLTLDGVCVSTNAEDDFVFSFDKLQDGAVYDFIGLEGEVTGTNVLRYETLNILQDQRERDLDVDNMAGIVFPNSAAFNRLLLTYGTGRISKYSLYELKLLAAQHNPGFLTQSFGYAQARTLPSVQADVLAMPLHALKRIEMDTDGSPLSFLTVFNRSRLAS